MSHWAAALLAGALVGAALAATLLAPWITRLRTALDEERSRRGSLASTFGRISEQWFPLTDAFPYDSRGFRFLGSPIDGIQFELVAPPTEGGTIWSEHFTSLPMFRAASDVLPVFMRGFFVGRESVGRQPAGDPAKS